MMSCINADNNSVQTDLCDTIQAEILELSKKEPMLKEQVSKLLPKNDTLTSALATHLADLIHTSDGGSTELASLFEEVMAADLQIAARASSDLLALRDRDPACTTYLHGLLNFKGFQALQAYRFAHFLWINGRTELASWVSNRASLILGPDIHPAAQLGTRIMLDHGSGIVIGETSVVGDDVSIMQNVTLGGTGKIGGDRHPKVRQGVMIGAGAIVLGNVKIGASSKVAAGSVVLQDVPSRCTVAGIPAQVVRRHDDNEMPAETMNQSV
jgi:serine O-acetyltransferase